jgi:drug/metabolite transporter (DMT)-like permease
MGQEDPAMLIVTLGLVGALIFGAADFLGGLASRRISALSVTAIVAASGLLVLLAATPLLPGRWSFSAVFLGGVSGITGAIAISLLYGCLAIGPMSILSPTTAVVSALVPMLAGLLRGERLPLLGYIAIGLALVAVVLVGFVPEKGAVRPSLKALSMAVGSGTMIGAFLILIDLTPDDSGVVPLIANRAVNAAIMLLVIGVLSLVTRRRATARSADLVGVGLPLTSGRDAGGVARTVSPLRRAQRGPGSTTGTSAGGTRPGQSKLWRDGLVIALVCGGLDAVANILLLIGLRIGELTVMSVLTALYPAGTILLAAIVLKERIAAVQLVGLVLAIAAASMLALAQ